MLTFSFCISSYFSTGGAVYSPIRWIHWCRCKCSTMQCRCIHRLRNALIDLAALQQISEKCIKSEGSVIKSRRNSVLSFGPSKFKSQMYSKVLLLPLEKNIIRPTDCCILMSQDDQIWWFSGRKLFVIVREIIPFGHLIVFSLTASWWIVKSKL